jgi:hypothetical protein
MSYYIVNVGTGRAFGTAYWLKTEYPTARGAKIACTKLNKKYGKDTWLTEEYEPQWKVVAREVFDAQPVKMVERVNLMSGKKFMEAEDTPNFCSPASESYWSS